MGILLKNRKFKPLQKQIFGDSISEKNSSPLFSLEHRSFRVGFIYLGFFLFFCLLFFRLFQLQIMPNKELKNLAEKQYRRLDQIAPYRHPIYDRNKEELAVSIPMSSVFARPRLIRQKKKTARILSLYLGGNTARWHNRIDTNKSFVWIHRQLASETAKKLAKLQLPGIFIEPENKRVFPNGELASQVIGFTDIDGNGLSGIELSLNKELLAKKERQTISRDGKGNPTYIDRKKTKWEDEFGITLTIDRRLQNAVEEELEQALQETGAKAAFAIVVDPYTGEIFALGQRPAFDPNHIQQAVLANTSNFFISHLYEPGSTIKPIFLAEAIERGLLRADSLIYCENGQMTVGKEVIKEAGHSFGKITAEEVLRYSSNVGSVKIIQTLGVDKACSALDRFRLTTKSEIALPGEVNVPRRSKSHWIPIHLATTGFGQGISVTPIQMVFSYAPFANGGYWVKPQILLKQVPSRANLVNQKRVLSPHTVSVMKKILISATEGNGATGQNAKVSGFKVGGKTGTAQKFELPHGYQSGKYFSSFIGFLPAEKPELLIGVFVDEPKKEYYAAQVAAPVFQRIAEKSLHVLDKLPRKKLAKSPLVSSPRFPASLYFEKKELPTLTVADAEKNIWIMPEITGIAARDVVRILGRRFSQVKLQGSGYASSQFPQAGTQITEDSPIRVEFSRR